MSAVPLNGFRLKGSVPALPEKLGFRPRDVEEVGQREAFQECIEGGQGLEVERLDGCIPQSRIFLPRRRAKAVRSVGSISEDAAIMERDSAAAAGRLGGAWR